MLRIFATLALIPAWLGSAVPADAQEWPTRSVRVARESGQEPK
jgi:hypothetical protein